MAGQEGQGDQKAGSGSAAVMVTAAAGGCGCLALPVGVGMLVAILLVIGGLAVLLLPLVVLFLIFNGLPLGGIPAADDLTPAEQRCEALEKLIAETTQEETAERTQRIVLGDGKGPLEIAPSDDDGSVACTVPDELLEPILQAGEVCDVIGPVTIAAQIQYESRFDTNFVGPNAAEGVSQVPPEVFTALQGEDADPFDPEESIAAQGDYLCDLAEQVQTMVDADEVEGNVLDLTLTAYDIGLDAVREAGGVPATEESQSYALGVRTWFAPMEGVGPPPRTLPESPGLFDS
ncbi:lytic transglycosylase domain-containing protein [Streptomyces cyaneofuscatus]|uniref:lytic transglycosylase domain-containing protein n=1 Tax=Streptomyces cyaneofuscatus TaxID=66883 RepID=UPI0033A5CB32